MPELLQIILWAIGSAAISMAIYAKLSPQQKLAALKAEQKTVRQQLLHYDGEMNGMFTLMKRDFSLSGKQIAAIFVPFILSVVPLIALIYWLDSIYGSGTYLNFGPQWMRGFEFSYIATLFIASIAIKAKFHII